LSRELLDAAGYADGFELTLPTVSLTELESEAVAQMLGDVGIDVVLAPLQGGQLGPEMRQGSFPAALTFTTEYHPHQTMVTFASGGGTFNPFGLEDTAHIDELLTAAATADPATARGLYAEAEREVIDAGIMIPIAFAPVVMLTGADVEGAFVPLGARSAPPYGLRIADS
jgi:peptide/nickel transport system substrate-binding protein